MQKFDTVICVSNGTELASTQACQIAYQHGIRYYGVLESATNLLPGGYHTSIYDITLLELSVKLTGVNRLKVIVLDQNESFYSNAREYHDTIEMAQALVSDHTVEFVNPAMSNPFRQLMEENKSFCILPFISTYNYVKHCCWMKKFDHYSNFYTGPNSIKMRQQMLAGERTDLCQTCYNFEDHNAISPRQIQTRDWTHILNLKSYDDVIKNTKLIKYEISIGNYCNLMCRICRPGNSNLIDKEYNNIGLETKKLGIIKNNSRLDQIDLDTVQQIIIVGGEPSISQDFYDFLKRCIHANKTDFEIFISTNCVSVTKEFILLIKQFKNIKISISVDGFEKINEYSRWPSDWEKFKRNITKLTANIAPYNYYFNSVVSIYNIACLSPLFNFLDKNYPTSAFTISILEEPTVLEAWNFPNKKLALEDLNKIKTLKKYHSDETFNSRINAIIHRIENCKVDYDVLAKFFEFNDRLDASRDVKLQDYIPELEACRKLIMKQT
jgi:hypothetical protein